MLDAVTKLAQDVLRDVRGALGDEVDAHALGADEADNLLNLVREGLGSAFKEHVGLVKEEYKLGKIHFSDLRKGGVELRHEPQQEGGVELGLKHQLVCGQHVHDAFAAFALKKVVYVEVRFSEELLRALVFQG